MSTFIVRVQLTNDTANNYTVLKDALLKSGFSKIITGRNKTPYVLPTGNYLIDSEKTVDDILGTVQLVLKRVGDTNAQAMVIETKKGGTSWVNLPIAK